MAIRPKKSLGQHFLNSEKALCDIMTAASISAGETILEIGPGTGVLTEKLLGTGAAVIAVEKDPRACDVLKEKFSGDIARGRLQLVHGDILDNNLVPVASPYTIVANIPYYITGAILEKFLEHGPRPDKMVIMVQKEVAERIISRDGKESILSISVKAFGTPRMIAKVTRGAFIPPPEVDSAILAIEDISDRSFIQSGIAIDRFFKIVKAGFAHKRKFLIRNLEVVSSQDNLEKVWSKLNIKRDVRAENLRTEMWLEISANLES